MVSKSAQVIRFAPRLDIRASQQQTQSLETLIKIVRFLPTCDYI
jgi:hypothetical protein